MTIPSIGARKAATPLAPGPQLCGVNTGMARRTRNDAGVENDLPIGGFFNANTIDHSWYNWQDSYPFFYKASIDFALKMGARVFRVLTPSYAYWAHANGVSYEYAMDKGTITSRYRQLCEYIASQGGYTFPCALHHQWSADPDRTGDALWDGPVPGVSPGIQATIDIAVAVCLEAVRVGNCVGIDLVNEYELVQNAFPNGPNIFNVAPSFRLNAVINAMRTELRAKAPRTPLCVSSLSPAALQQQQFNVSESLSDFRDAHQYFMSNEGHNVQQRPVIDEFRFLTDNDPAPQSGRLRADMYQFSGESGWKLNAFTQTQNQYDDNGDVHFQRWIAQFESPSTVTGSPRLCGGCMWQVFHQSDPSGPEELGLVNVYRTSQVEAALAAEAAAKANGTYNYDIWPMTIAKGAAIRAGTLVPTPGTLDALMYPKMVGRLSEWFGKQIVPNANGHGIPRFLSPRARRGTTRLATKLAPWKDEVLL